ncbi:MAG: CDP-alcohol phosphatidyltransferase family protein [Crocinitomicaceae bacterium]
MQIIRQIPNILTAGNLLFGSLAIFFALTGHLSWAPWCIFISAFLDFFDGFAARKLGVTGELGKQLDSLADMVTFGLAPGIIMVILINLSLSNDLEKRREFIQSIGQSEQLGEFQKNYKKDAPDLLVLNSLYNHSRAMHFNKGLETDKIEGEKETPVWMSYLPFTGLLIAIFSLFRLAKFNIDPRQTDGFIGLATPANTIFFVGFVFILHSYLAADQLTDWQASLALFLLDYKVLIAFTILFSFLLVSEIRLFSLKVKGFGWKGNEIRYVFVLICIGWIVLLQLWSFPFIILTYILISVGSTFRKKDN